MAIRKEAEFLYRSRYGLTPGSGRLMIFGRPTLMWDGAPSPEDFFRSFGYSEVHTLDVSPHEGATFIHDLNDPDPPAELVGRYDVVMSGGTLEHVFCFWNAIKVAIRLLADGGLFLCATPANNWVDHGFYQISPTLKFDYFGENGFEFGISAASFIDPKTQARWRIPLYPGEAGALNFTRERVGHHLEVRKTPACTLDRIPKQGVYLDRQDGRRRQFRFRACEPLTAADDAIALFPMRRFPLDRIRPLHGRYAAEFRHPDFPPSLERRPFRSKALVYENGELLPWIVSSPDLVGDRPGSFAHFPGFIHFTASDGSDPRTNGKAYEVAFPAAPPAGARPGPPQA